MHTVWCGVVWCGVVWCGVEEPVHTFLHSCVCVQIGDVSHTLACWNGSVSYKSEGFGSYSPEGALWRGCGCGCGGIWFAE